MGKTVTTYLIDGDPKGTQYVFISNKICQMYVIPRSNLSILNERQELQTPAFYILLGENEATKPKAYIGETENFPHVNDYRNNVVAGIMKTLSYVNMFNHGITEVQELLKENNNPPAVFNVNYLTVFSVIVKDNVTKDVTKDSIHELTERQKVILMAIKENPLVTIPEMSLKMNVVTRTIKRDIEVLKSKGFLKREGSRKEGHWEIVDENMDE